MKRIASDNDRFVFHLTRREKDLLHALLRRYPLVPAGHARSAPAPSDAREAESRRLLAEALESQRAENRRQVQALLNEPGRFQPADSGYHLTLQSPQVEWLLQVLNDVRVGSWIALGSPDTEAGERIPYDEQTAPLVWAMELAGHFEGELLDALDEGPPE